MMGGRGLLRMGVGRLLYDGYVVMIHEVMVVDTFFSFLFEV